MNKYVVSTFVSGVALAIAATPVAAQSENAAFVDKDFGCAMNGFLVGVPAFLFTTETIDVATKSGNIQLTCHFDIPLGLEPDKAMNAWSDSGCTVKNEDGLVFGASYHVRANPGGNATLTCMIKGNAP